MKLRRLEFAILALTLAFAVFIGGYFTGRAGSAGGFTSVVIDTPAATTVPEKPVNPDIPGNNHNPPQDTATEKPPGNSDNSAPPQDTGTGTPVYSDGKININTATHGELIDLPGIGNALASRIINYRVQNGLFQNIEDIRNVSGIGERRYEAIKDLIKVE